MNVMSLHALPAGSLGGIYHRETSGRLFMSNATVLITGALTGIGRATAFTFASKGAKIAVSGRHLDKGNELAAELKRKGASDAIFLKADVRSEPDVSALVDEVIGHFGQLDVA